MSVASAHSHAVVLILDYGSQYTQLITRRVRELSMFSVLFPGDASLVSYNTLKTMHGSR
jgi:GMP synthase (glutamine-hydrolysing)